MRLQVARETNDKLMAMAGVMEEKKKFTQKDIERVMFSRIRGKRNLR
jgi:predicted GNAT family N-acyltransferase